MVRPEVLQRRLEQLAFYLEVLERLRRYDEATFLADPEHYGSAERFLQLAIEALNDMGGHVVADLQLGRVRWARDIPRLLREKGYLDSRLESIWLQMIGFRNILVHDYLDLDRRVVYQVLQKHLDDLRVLASVFARFLE